ncbi:MAG TPA: sigma-70 family RNA polymerase sigma factor [Chloroflexia bacterium]|nr:sigma-70 family RNA polymerase sigma factor [Chloroflexia bacterium]
MDHPANLATSQSDVDLMTAVCLGQHDAMQELYDRYFRRSYALALRILSDTAAAEDCAHDVFLKLWQRPYMYDATRGAFVNWFLTIVHNNAIKHLRSRQRTQPMSGPGVDGAEEMPAPELADREAGQSSVEDLLGQAETSQVIHAALAQLNTQQRAALELAYFRGMTQSEIAAYLQEPLGTVKTRIRTGMLKLRSSLEAQGWGKEVARG